MFADPTVVSRMERVGKDMVEKCKHLPLAISSIGGILNGKSLREWEMINKDILFYLGEGGVTEDDEYYTVRQVLGLSYDSLPPRLRHCFLCLANFKEDEVIKIEELYILWMAEGLISVEHKAEGMMLLDVADSFMDELAHRSLVQIQEDEDTEFSWSKYKLCSVHDLIRDLCLSKAKEEKFIKVVHLQPQPKDESGASKARRLCINPYDESLLEPCDKEMISHVRSLFVVKSGMFSGKSLSLLQNFKLLRILTAQNFIFTKKEMKIISELVYLKCLRLRRCSLEELPSSISNLRNLEILDLEGSNGVMVANVMRVMVANVMWKLKHLKYLYLPCQLQVVEKYLRFKGLDELEVIHKFDSINCDTYELIGLCKLKVLSGSFNLSDANLEKKILDYINFRELRHSDLSIVSTGDGLSLVSWLECCFINVLEIRGPICRWQKDYDHTRLSSSCLAKLILNRCRTEEDPMMLLEKLPNLRQLHLNNDAYLGTEMVCTAKGFPKLQRLSLDSLRGLKQWRVEKGAMPNLSYLQIEQCQELEMLPEGLRYLAALKSLVIISMPVAFDERITGIDRAEGVDMYKISHVQKLDVIPEGLMM